MEIQDNKYPFIIKKGGITFFSKLDLGTLESLIPSILKGKGKILDFDYKNDIKKNIGGFKFIGFNIVKLFTGIRK